ncbi:hypothetical protein ACGFYZ_37005 [Streptomyces sp. NPDC048330]|uniref:hypothetical protein n=1 Tax=Streptomyces sp. NPDC048330 TaxID=3365533 RepID=UPI003720A8E0
MRADALHREYAEVAAALDDARSRKRFAAGLDEVWEAAEQGRVQLVAVDEQGQSAVRLIDGHLAPVDADTPGTWDDGVREDIVDELVETALDSGAQVAFLPEGELDAHGRVAAVLRY